MPKPFVIKNDTSVRALVAASLPSGVSLHAWANRTCVDHGYSTPYHALRHIIRSSSVARTKIRQAAALIGCSQEALSLACYGVSPELVRSTYAKDTPEVRRAKNNARNRDRTQKRIAAGGLSYRQRAGLGLVPAEEADERRVARRRREKMAENARIKERNNCILLDGKRTTLHAVRLELSSILRSVCKLERQFSSYQSRFNKPWGAA